MKQFRNFTAEQKHINEIGPVGATIAGVMGLIGGYKAVKAGLKKFKGYRENRADKKARREQGFDMKVKVYNPETGKDEDQEFYIDPKEGNKELEALTGGKFPERTLTGKIKAPTDDDLDKMEKEANRSAKRKNAEVRRKIDTGDIKDSDLTADQKAKLEKSKKEKEKKKADDVAKEKRGGIEEPKDAEEYYKNKGKAPNGWTDVRTDKEKADGVSHVGKILPRADAAKELKRQRKVGKRGRGGKDTSKPDKPTESNMLKFGEFIQEDVVSDLKKISKSKKDMEIKLGDGSEIPIDPTTADIFVKYIEGLKSSEQKRVINQIQRTERGFMKVLGKAHGE